MSSSFSSSVLFPNMVKGIARVINRDYEYAEMTNNIDAGGGAFPDVLVPFRFIYPVNKEEAIFRQEFAFANTDLTPYAPNEAVRVRLLDMPVEATNYATFASPVYAEVVDSASPSINVGDVLFMDRKAIFFVNDTDGFVLPNAPDIVWPPRSPMIIYLP